jgi:hypothetical protein
MARSFFPSPSKSAITMLEAFLEIVIFTGESKLIVPIMLVFLYTAISDPVTLPYFVIIAISGLPSPSISPTAIPLHCDNEPITNGG